MNFAVFGWQHLVIRLKGRGKFALALIADLLPNLRQMQVCFQQQLCRQLHAVFFDVRRDGGSIHRLEYLF